MTREADLERRLESLTALREAVGAMKSLSAHHFRDARRAVEPARVYREGVERLLHAAKATLAAGDGPPGLLVIGGELGLCGAYNARVVSTAEERRADLGEGPTFCVGERAATLLARRGVEVESRYGAPTSVGGITGALIPLAESVLNTYIERRLSSLDIVSCRFGGVGSITPETIRLLPLGSDAGEAAPPVRYTTMDDFASTAAREFLYVTLYDLLLDALASEHGARLLATEAAERWLGDRTDELRRRLTASRREAATQEVIEIASGARNRQASLRDR
jgi:F-type H+-transporting ATPase subunit gamma